MVRVLTFAELDSTSSEARRRSEAGETGPLWIRADRQTAGRGRRGRAWDSPLGNLMASGLFTVDATPGEAAKLSFAAALSVAQTCDVFTPTPLACLKWPNDVLIDGRKLAGLLLESWTVGTRLSLCVGIGVNLAHHPGGTEYPATHLDLFTQAPVAAAAFLPILIERFAGWMDRWRADGFAPIRAGWLARAAGVGGPVTVRLEGEHFSGVFEDLDETGALVVRLDNGTVRTVHAGDVFLHG